LKKKASALPTSVRLAKLVREDQSGAQIVIDRFGARIAISPGFDRITLRAVLEVLAEMSNAR
jgi:hypothetical protein